MSGSGGVKDVMVVLIVAFACVRALETDELYPPLGFKFFDWDEVMGL